MRIVQVANFVSPTSGGLRTTLRHLAEGYADHGHEVVQVIPGTVDDEVETPWGRQVVRRSPALGSTGYRLLLDRSGVRRALERVGPDVLEVHDRTTLRGLGRWARARGIPALVVSHERLDRWLGQWLPARLPLTALADRSNAALAGDFDTVVCTTGWAAEEFRRLHVPNLAVFPLAVDTAAFRARTGRRAEVPRSPRDVVLVLASRLSREKRPEVAVATLRALLGRGVAARLVVAGDGPLRPRMQAAARDLPVEWLGFVADRARLAGVLAAADVALAPGPIETFGLAALEALACGTPVVADSRSALPGVLGPHAGRSAPGDGAAFADAVQDLLATPEVTRRTAARALAEEFSWQRTVRGFLHVHQSGRPGAA
ncbi:glycosyltransferase [Geodermatophilus poikilotrophus]|uniref:Alpha-1,6-mannosyltransferase n=1 Tax=Geodermatophilus poikilotrophus TaxID=1333667 RepID=A0A1I0D1W0_9ACTN|nr:glycosyltransferase [Geodermatophilus poikilotrophus]SET26071.1 alpha-1,6-mannosyltransferase [Geodermatophilus poikilotrophus]